MSEQEPEFQGKWALITGSTSGIGLGIAKALCAKGAKVILSGLGEPSAIKAIQDDFENLYGHRPPHYSGDLSKAAEVENMCKNILHDRQQGVDILVNNAGFQHVASVETFDIAVWDSMMGLMLTAPFLFTKYLLPKMREKQWGRIINISSAHGLVASANKTGYVTCKHGIIGLTKVLALETAGSGVTCNALCPGYVDTPILEQQVRALAYSKNIPYEDAEKEFLSRFHPSGSPVGIDHLASMVCFICSEAGSQMTGSSLVMDGGWTAK